MSLRKKFLLIFLLISSIPLVIITIYTYNRYTLLINQQTTQVSENIVSNAVNEANGTIKNIKHISEIFNFDSDNQKSIVEELHKYTADQKNYTAYDVLQSNNNIKFICQNLIYSSDYINGIFVFTPSGEVLGYGYGNNIDVKFGYDPAGDDWYKKTLAKKGKIFIDGVSDKSFLIGSKPSISFSTALSDVYTKEFLGVLFIDCSPTVFDVSSSNTLPGAALLAIENNNTILFSNINTLPDSFNNKNSLQYQKNLDLDGLTLTAIFSNDKLYEEFGSTRNTLIIFSLLCISMVLIISIFLSESVTKPIVLLSKKMGIRDGDNQISDSIYMNRSDEIGILYNEYQDMIEQLSHYIKTELQNKLITLDSQMRSLEAQINSHFLYNTLESINSIAEIEEVESISVMSLALGNMFRYSIKTKSELVSIADEIGHVKDYIAIQSIRFDNRFQLLLEIPEEMYSLKVLKLILQPIVENALYHGLQYCQFGSYIRISGYVHQDCIYITISDDGVGMSPGRLLEMQTTLNEKAQFTELGQRTKQSIGIKNINTRIQLYYGVGYGLSITSKEQKGTTITLKLPLL